MRGQGFAAQHAGKDGIRPLAAQVAGFRAVADEQQAGFGAALADFGKGAVECGEVLFGGDAAEQIAAGQGWIVFEELSEVGGVLASLRSQKLRFRGRFGWLCLRR